MKLALRSAYRRYWFAVSPSKLVVRHTVRRYFGPRHRAGMILELGGGTSMMRRTFELACQPQHLVSSDIEATEMTDLVCDAQALPFPDDTFDVVVALELMEHLPETDRFLREVHRVGRQGGHLVVSVPFLFGVHDHHDFYRFTPQGLEHVLARHGLTTVVQRKSGGTWHALVVLVIEYIRTFGLPPADGWRSRGGGRQAHLVASTIVTMPLIALSWLAFAFDAIVDRDSRNPSGMVVIARISKRFRTADGAGAASEASHDARASS